MNSNKSKTKKVFIEVNTNDNNSNKQIQEPPQSLNNLLRRFKSHDVYNTTATSSNLKSKLSNQMLRTSNNNDNATITINLNSPTNTEPSNSLIKHANSKNLFSNPKTKTSSKCKSTTANWLKQGETKINSYINSGRKRNKIDTIKILNEESIQELETEENCKCCCLFIFI